ncbi:MAG TPA: DUF4097 family beta strand repeat-containing protein [Blastocatellia bacterium]|nr:DUF4097 family beta strand repeat-containing protein [Blastocatellia bacterium]
MASGRNNRRGTLLLGLLLLGVGLVLVFAPAGSGVAGWLMRLWPVFLICAGVVRVMGFAVERKPRSPLIGMLLILVGVLFLVARFQPGLNALQVYGRYWVLLLVVFGSVELVRFYSHGHAEGPPPRVFTPMRVIVVLLIVVTGVLANRAANNPAVLSALRLPAFLSGLRDSVVGNAYAFTDQPIINSEVSPGMRVFVNNSYGSVRISGAGSAVKTTLVKGVRGWSEDEARKIADQIHLVVSRAPEGLTISTNRDQVNEQFTTDIMVEVPPFASVSIVGSYGSVTANGIQGLTAQASYGQAEIAGVRGDVNLSLSYSDVNASNIDGDLTITGAKRARISNLAGGLDLTATGGAVDLREISGPIRVSAPFSRIVAQGLEQSAELKTEHASVDVSRAADLVIEAPHSDVRLKNIDGDVKVLSSNSNIQLASISGDLSVHAEQSSVSADDVRSAVTIETSHGDVTVKNFLEGIRVTTSYRDVTLVAADEPAGDIEVQNNHGQIKLVMPSSSRFQLDAQSANGRILPVGFSQLEKKVRESLVAALGPDGPTIKLRTSYKNIIIQAAAARQTQANAVVNPAGEDAANVHLPLAHPLAA